MQIYFVGGAVRDLVLGRATGDKDYLVLDANESEFLAAFPLAKKVGKSFPVFVVDGSEFSFLRGKNLEEDLAARDITINSMALSPEGSLICHPQAIDDIKNKIIRPSSLWSTKADPLRVFRYARFSAMLPDFSPHPTLLSSMKGVARSPAFKDIAGERIGAETRKALAAKLPENYLRLLHDGDCLSPWFKTCTAAFDNLMRTMALLHGKPYALWAVICCSGCTCASLAEQNVQNLGKLLRMPNIYTEIGVRVVKSLERAMQYDLLSSEERVDLLMKAQKHQSYIPLFQIVTALGGRDHLPQVEKELALISQVSLPQEKRNLGPQSGILLSKLRSVALAKACEKKTC